MGEWMKPRIEMLIYPIAQLPPNFSFTLSFYLESFLGNGTLFLLTFPLTR